MRQSRTRSPQAFWSVGGCQERIHGTGILFKFFVWPRNGFHCFTQKSSSNKIPVPQSLSWRPCPPADQKAWGLWVRDCNSIGYDASNWFDHFKSTRYALMNRTYNEKSFLIENLITIRRSLCRVFGSDGITLNIRRSIRKRTHWEESPSPTWQLSLCARECIFS